MMADDLLDCLLSAAIEEIPKTSGKQTSPKTSFDDTLNILDQVPDSKSKKKKSLAPLSTFSTKAPGSLKTIHRGDTDSSDDEDNRDFENRKYNESGRNIKHLLETSVPAAKSYSRFDKPTWMTKREAKKPAEKSNPIFGIRIINPLVSSKVMEDRMVGREVVPMAAIKMFVRNLGSDKDWVIAGVIVHKSSVKTSQKGKNYCMWTLSDLKTDLKTVVVFLFGSAYKELWKTVTGTVVGILNPSVMELRDGAKDEACLSVDNHQRVMIIGQSKDLGTCKSNRKSGERCTAFVNTNSCEFCIYHVKMEYQKCSKRSELQSGFAGRGLTALRNKVLGKNQVFYAGKMYSAIPARKNKKQTAKDQGRLLGLAGFGSNIKAAPTKTQKQKQAARLEIAVGQKQRDLERLRQLGINTELNLNNRVEKFNAALSRDVTVEDSKNLALDVIGKLKKSLDTKKNDANVKPLRDDKKETPERVEENSQNESNVDLNVELKKSDKLTRNVEKISGMRLISKSDDDVDLNVDFKSFRNNFLKPLQTPKQDGEIFKPISEGNKPKNTLELDQEPKEYQNSNKKTGTSTKKNSQDLGKSPNPKNTLELDQGLNKYQDVNKKTDTRTKITNFPQDIGNSSNLQNFKNPSLTNVPFLSNQGKSKIDLTVPVRKKQTIRAKQNALSWVQHNGPLKKQDPNNTRGSEKGKKRALDTDTMNENPKKSKIEQNDFFSDRFKKMMAVTSNHTDLLEERDNEEQEKYFNKLEMKERMEEKMLTTYKVACKAVRCLKCKYTSFSASDMCKTERHPLRVYDAMKRFFKCGNCGNRTVCLTMVPTTPCKNCGSSKWEKTSMMKERKVEIAAPKLSIRGGEQKYTNSIVGNANLDLMVPDEV